MGKNTNTPEKKKRDYTPRTKRNLKEISKEMGVGIRQVQRYISSGKLKKKEEKAELEKRLAIEMSYRLDLEKRLKSMIKNYADFFDIKKGAVLKIDDRDKLSLGVKFMEVLLKEIK